MIFSCTECPHQLVQHNYCRKCGVYVYFCDKLRVQGLKHYSLFREISDSEHHITKLRKGAFRLKGQIDVDTYRMSAGIQEAVRICERLQTSLQTKMLSIYLLIHCLSKGPNSDQENSSTNSLCVQRYSEKTIGFYCVSIALKTLQPDLYKKHYYMYRSAFGQSKEKPPGSSILKKSECETGSESGGSSRGLSLIFIELEILRRVQFKVNIVTFVDFLEFYVMAGVTFNTEYKANNLKVTSLIDRQVEWYIEGARFVQFDDQEKLALTILYRVRQSCEGIDEIWNWHLETITGRKLEQVLNVLKESGSGSLLKENINSCNRLHRRKQSFETEAKYLSKEELMAGLP